MRLVIPREEGRRWRWRQWRPWVARPIAGFSTVLGEEERVRAVRTQIRKAKGRDWAGGAAPRGKTVPRGQIHLNLPASPESLAHTCTSFSLLVDSALHEPDTLLQLRNLSRILHKHPMPPHFCSVPSDRTLLDPATVRENRTISRRCEKRWSYILYILISNLSSVLLSRTISGGSYFSTLLELQDIQVAPWKIPFRVRRTSLTY